MTKALLRQSTLYLLVGGMVYLADLLSFTGIVLIWPGQHLVANVAGKLLGALIGFFLHKYITFAGRQRDSGLHQAIGYVCLLAGNIAMGTILIYMLVDVLELPKIPARIAVDSVVIAATFLISRNRIFRRATGVIAKEQASSEKGLTT